MKQYNCALCNAPVTVLDGMTEVTCAKCGNIIRIDGGKAKTGRHFKLLSQAMILMLLIAALVGIWVYIGVGRSPVESPVVGSSQTFGKIDSISTENYANTKLDYFYYIPPKVIKDKQESYPLLVMVPGQSGRGESFVPIECKNFADEYGFIIIAPSFMLDEANWAAQQSYQYPAVWSGDALIKIVEQVEEKDDVTISGFYMFGLSAGAQYSARFCLWRPELCVACAAHAFGSPVLPTQYVDVKFLVTVGTQDTSRIDIVKGFYNAADGLGIDVTYKEYVIGHALSPAQVSDSLEFFEQAR